ncbi:MAG: spore coat protein CotH [Winogradskyella sp.]|uniref:CotH kinase family protein n=1 Tax=Winogradskyella sp. TaxID=1883156 RepID=UPI000F3B36CE|nr:CotH kinase family protein [Winogradskyella sp.]RNC84848.1 MAG: spore coat protein CotH [Winogradskyella sp.]
MRKYYIISITIIFFSLPLLGFSQTIKAQSGSFGVDSTNNIIIWHIADFEQLDTYQISGIDFGELFKLDKPSKLNYTDVFSVTAQDKTYKLFITSLPVIHLKLNASVINNRKKSAGILTYYNDQYFIEACVGVRHRGNLSLTFAKKSYDLEFWKDSDTKETVDVQFRSMRSDDDWMLDAMYNEPLRLRSMVAIKLWLNIHKPYYFKKEPEAKNGFEAKYVEVFKNGEYQGLYQLCEPVDKKQLKLKSHHGDSINGQLYEANSYKGGPSFIKISEPYNNIFPHWNGWKTEYPLIDYRSDYQDLYNLQDLVINGSNSEFKSKISSLVDLDNVIDYYLFVNVIRATDNLGKNYFLAKYDKDEPFFFVPWDLDGTFGVIQDGKRIVTTDDVLTNGLFKRLIALNPNNYTSKLKRRWDYLRKGEFSNSVIWPHIEVIYEKFTKENVYMREHMVWQNKLTQISNEKHFEYIKDWFERRMIYLDSYIKSL